MRWSSPPQTTITVTVTGAMNGLIHDVLVAVDGQQICVFVPCTFRLEPGLHALRAQGTDDWVHDETISVRPGADLMLRIERAKATVAPRDRSPSSDDEQRGGAATAVPSGFGIPTSSLLRDTGSSKKPMAAREPGAPETATRAGPSQITNPETKMPSRPVRDPEPKWAEAAGGNCSLRLNSIPVSNVTVDNEPYGSTPVIGVKAASGTHTIAFVLPDGAREVRSVACKPGESRSVSVLFESAQGL